MKILGLDPGSRILGYGIIESVGSDWRRVESGVVRLDVKQPVSERLVELFNDVQSIIDTHQPDSVSIEECFVAQSPKAALVLGEVRGVLILAARLAKIPVEEYAPRAVKLAAVGNGGAAKKQVQEMIRRVLRGCPARLSPDEADALAVAWCAANQQSLRQAIRSAGTAQP